MPSMLQTPTSRSRRAGGRGQSLLLIGDRLESYIETNYPLADDPVREVTVDAEDGVITISVMQPVTRKPATRSSA